jgi:ankyrin repeat protein
MAQWTPARVCRAPPALVALNAATIVETLVRANARIDDADDKGCTACHAAASNRRADLLALLLAASSTAAIQALLDHGVVVRGAPRHYAWHTAAHVCSLWRCGHPQSVLTECQ